MLPLNGVKIMCRPAKSIKIESCIEILKESFNKFKDPRNTKQITISLPDFLMSSYAVFALKYPSLLSFQTDFYSGTIAKSCSGLFGIKSLPSDTHLRDVMDVVDHRQFRPIFKKLFAFTQRNKLLENFEFLKVGTTPYYLLAGDGTGYFSSHKINCSGCSIYNEDDEDKVTRFGHQVFAASIVHPDRKEVLPMCPEPIYKEDGLDKNDCELNAFKRFIKDFKREHPKLNVIFLGDALYANGVAMDLLESNKMHFILNIKLKQQVLLSAYNKLKSRGMTAEVVVTEKSGSKIVKTTQKVHRYINGYRYAQQSQKRVNFIELVETVSWLDKAGDEHIERKKFTWITNINITDENVEKLAKGARSRWKIENETFNTLKNHGYNLEHNYGHGKKDLSKNLITMMFIAFYIDQIQQASCQRFKRMVERLGKRSYVWRKLKELIDLVPIEGWDVAYGILSRDVKISINTC